ncbi:hypothetical protein A2635_00310 [Candidatus Peribacteria bacterium RIFCSPHIGHO2_01_FULL_51_9]|nr:MAG: hypothetical protein A2635_00310 [Candidatus Peribacteria bacterium RIFCSPHIGHO2_01_FULL_51_9]
MKSSFSDAPRIGIVTWDFDPPRGGLGRALQEMVHALRERHVHVDVYTVIQTSFFSRLLFSISLLWKLSRWVNRHRIDLLLLPTGPGGLFLMRRLKNCRCIVLSYHTYLQQARYVPGEWWKAIFVPFERHTFNLADSVFCYCEDTQNILRKEYGVRDIRLLPQILEVEPWMSKGVSEQCRCDGSMVRQCSPQAPLIMTHRHYQKHLCLFIGRPDRRKGIHVLWRAWKGVSECLPDAKLRIIQHGDLPQAELIALVQSADLVICPSYLEGFGLVAVEAMAAGTPVIACDSDGIRSLIRHAETGWLVPRGDAIALAQGITRLLMDESLRKRLAVAAQKDVRLRFERQKSVSALLQTVLEIRDSSPD